MKRRAFVAGAMAFLAAGCTKIGRSDAGARFLAIVERWNEATHKALRGDALAPEYSKADISPDFKGNGSRTVDTDDYRAHLANGFVDWELEVKGLVENPMTLSLDNIRKLPQRTQITRHDCVEGWSAIGEWTGPQLSVLLDGAQLKPEAKYIVFHCADELSGRKYYESIDLDDAFHPQTIIAHLLNGETIPEKNGAPLRLRVERQLGYKHAKYLTGIEAVASLEDIGEGKGGYWEDRYNYQWYAGI